MADGHLSYYFDDLVPLFEDVKILNGRESVFPRRNNFVTVEAARPSGLGYWV